MKIWERGTLERRKPVLSTESVDSPIWNLNLWQRWMNGDIASTFVRSHVGVNCVSVHPGQPNVLVSGDSEGSVVYWDIRNMANPYSIEKKVHSSESESQDLCCGLLTVGSNFLLFSFLLFFFSFSFFFFLFSFFFFFLLLSFTVWEVAFHPTQPNEVFSCSEDGSVGLSSFKKGQETPAPRHFHNLLATRLSVNSFDISEDLLVYGTDNECLVYAHVPS